MAGILLYSRLAVIHGSRDMKFFGYSPARYKDVRDSPKEESVIEAENDQRPDLSKLSSEEKDALIARWWSEWRSWSGGWG